MAEPENAAGQATGSAEKLYTLSEISQRTGISMPTLQRYKKTYQARIPSVGTGRKQRYPEAALPVFGELRSENAGRRGRPRKDASARPTAAGAAKTAGAKGRGGRTGRGVGRPRRTTRAAAAAAPARTGRTGRGPGRPAARRGPGRPPGRAATRRTAAATGRGRRTAGTQRRGGAGAGRATAGRRGAAGARGGRSAGLLTLTRISELTGISYPTLVRYVRLYSDRLPHEGKGRARRFHQAAVEVFRRLRQESGRGGRRKGSTTGAGRGRGAGAGAREGLLARQLRALEKSQQTLEKKFRTFARDVQKLFR
jgi:hypothetical protein